MPSLAGLPRGRTDDDLVQSVHAAVVQRRIDFVVLHARFGCQERIGPADRQAVRRQREVIGNDDLGAGRIDVNRRRTLHGVGHALEADPAAGEAGHGPAVQSQVEDFLHRRRIEHGHHRRAEHVVGLVRQRGRLGRVVVAGQHEHAAVLRRAGEVGVLEHVAAAVHARTFAVPHREYAIDFGARVQVHLLRAPDRRRGKILVQARLELDVGAVQELLRLPQRLVERAERRTAVTRDEATGVEPGQLVALALQDEKPYECLCAGEVDAAGFELVLVVERDFAQRRGSSCRGRHSCTPQKIVSFGTREKTGRSRGVRATGIVSPKASGRE